MKHIVLFFILFNFISTYSYGQTSSDQWMKKAVVAKENGNFKEAIQIYHTVIKQLGSTGQLSQEEASTAFDCFNGIGNLYLTLVSFDSAQFYFSKSQGMLTSILRGNLSKEASYKKSLGRLNLLKGEYKSSLQYYKEAEKI